MSAPRAVPAFARPLRPYLAAFFVPLAARAPAGDRVREPPSAGVLAELARNGRPG